MNYLVNSEKTRGSRIQLIPSHQNENDENSEKKQIDNTFKCMHLDKVNSDYTIVEKSPYRTKLIAGVLMLDKMFGRYKNKLLYRCIPYNKNLPIFLIPYEEKTSFSKKKTHKYVVFTYVNWENKHPIGVLARTIGNVDDLSCLYDYLLNGLELHISNTKFTNFFVKSFKQHSMVQHIQQIRDSYLIQDRRNWTVYTIDGSTTEDYDDGFGYREFSDGRVCVSIYISNVVIWMEQLKLWEVYGGKTTTIYLPDKSINMLPSKLTNEICALKEQQLSVAFAMDIIVDKNGVIEHEYHNVVVSVNKNFVYEEQSLLHNKMYKDTIRLLKRINIKVTNSRNLIEHLMIYFNSTCGNTMATYNNGIYRYCNTDKQSICLLYTSPSPRD